MYPHSFTQQVNPYSTMTHDEDVHMREVCTVHHVAHASLRALNLRQQWYRPCLYARGTLLCNQPKPHPAAGCTLKASGGY